MIEVYLYEVRVHPVCEGFLLHSLILTCGGWREGGGEKRWKKKERRRRKKEREEEEERQKGRG